jgi:hypothetical protein
VNVALLLLVNNVLLLLVNVALLLLVNDVLLLLVNVVFQLMCIRCPTASECGSETTDKFCSLFNTFNVSAAVECGIPTAGEFSFYFFCCEYVF